jgi:hypothetical protein
MGAKKGGVAATGNALYNGAMEGGGGKGHDMCGAKWRGLGRGLTQHRRQEPDRGGNGWAVHVCSSKR